MPAYHFPFDGLLACHIATAQTDQAGSRSWVRQSPPAYFWPMVLLAVLGGLLGIGGGGLLLLYALFWLTIDTGYRTGPNFGRLLRAVALQRP